MPTIQSSFFSTTYRAATAREWWLNARLLAVAALAVSTVFGQPLSRQAVRSHVNVINISGEGKREVFGADRLFEAPNWSRDGRYLVVNSEGKLWRLAAEGGEPELIPTGAVNRVNNDHGISPDGKWLAISAGPIYVLPWAGGVPRQVTQLAPSYYHGWSPDGKTVVYCARRDSNFDIYAIDVSGGEKIRLTVNAGYDDGPDYSPDGKWIYFNSDRSGSWDIWRMPAAGAGPDDKAAERITTDEMEDWFPHPSPDGKWLVFLSYEKGTKGHPANQNVVLRRMRLSPDVAPAPEIAEVVKLFGGQGTINVNSWSPDSKRFAYVSYSPRPH